MEWKILQAEILWFPITMIALCAALGLYTKAHAKRNPTTLLEKFERELLDAQKIERDKGVLMTSFNMLVLVGLLAITFIGAGVMVAIFARPH